VEYKTGKGLMRL